jgi:hypothetical protein
MKRRSTSQETIEPVASDITRDGFQCQFCGSHGEGEVKQEAAGADDEGAVPGVPQADPHLSSSPWESRISSLDARVMMLQERMADQEGESKTEILAMLADLFDAQISAALIASGCQSPASGTRGTTEFCPPSSRDYAREYALGLGSTSVAGTSSAIINVQPQVVFRPERLVIPASIAEDFLINDIKVGKNSQLVSTGALPAAAFTPGRSDANRLMMDTAQIAMFVTISVTNTTKKSKNFQGVIFGPSVDPSWASSAKRFSARRSW